jgi:acetate kinase
MVNRGMITLSINCGSSSVKFALFDPDLKRLAGGLVEGTGAAALAEVAARIAGCKSKIAAIGHRVVHGGTHFSAPVIITPEVRRKIEELTPVAPEHQPHHIAGIDAMTNLFPHCEQIACFDTAFHRSIPKLRQEMALPERYAAEGLLRYGFHGLSCQFVSEQFPGQKLIICHLGNGCSVTAVDKGKSQYTSMGFTPSDGLMMGTRSGAIDPGALLWLVEKLGSAQSVRTLINRESGLKGVSGISSDMRQLLASDNPRAAFAVAMFVDRLVLEIGRAAASLQGFDVLAFAGGIGENAVAIRKAALAHLQWLGLELDEAANAGGSGTITTRGRPRQAAVIHTDEERVIAKAVAAMLSHPPPRP